MQKIAGDAGIRAMAARAGGRLTVLYDGACPLCRREIAHYQRLDRHSRMLWLDIGNQPELLGDSGIDHREALAYFHTIGPDGRLYPGASGFAAIWSRLPRYRWLARFCRLPGVLPVLEWLYRRFAALRARRRAAAPTCPTCPSSPRSLPWD